MEKGITFSGAAEIAVASLLSILGMVAERERRVRPVSVEKPGIRVYEFGVSVTVYERAFWVF